MIDKLIKESLDKAKYMLLGLSVVVLIVASVSGGQSQPASPVIPGQEIVKMGVAKDSLDQKTGLVIAPGFNIVSTTCIKCHSPKLITEKRATREGWLATIRWMQQNQGLWDLGKEEPVILDYLAKNYAPQNEGRRPLLKVTEWYKLNN